ncbi:MAG TPA: DUF2780 domain-containing protein [Gemmataceae bacterium]|jgi:hypothetical protein
MIDIVTELANKTGLSPEQTKKALGALLGLVKSHVPAEQFARLSQAVPGTDEMMAAAQADSGSSGGVLSAVAGMAGKLFGGGDACAALADKLEKSGLSADQIKTFLPHALEFLKSKLPSDVAEKLGALLPAEAPAV